MEETELTKAKQKFLQSAEAATLSNAVRKHPLPSVGAAAAIGALLALPRGGNLGKGLRELIDIALLLARKLAQISLDENRKLDK